MMEASQAKPFSLDKSARQFAVLIDPDKHSGDELFDFLQHVREAAPDFVFLGGSLVYKSSIEETARKIKAVVECPVILFPGHFNQLTDDVDAVLLLSLISGRNADTLIGQHVLAAPQLKRLNAQIVSTGYMLIDGGRPTSVSYMSHSQPIPHDKEDIAVCTALAGQYLGMSVIYMDAGSGASTPLSSRMVKSVAEQIDVPLIVGGGIRNAQKLTELWDAGANLVVIGNGLEEKRSLFAELSALKRVSAS